MSVLDACAPVSHSLMTFGCEHCGAVLSVPREKAGISGPCPFCGEWLASPREKRVCPPPAVDVPMIELGAGQGSSRSPKFAARTVLGPLPDRAESREESDRGKKPPQVSVDWRMRRMRRTRARNWFERRQLAICIIAFVLSVSLVASLQSMGWNLPFGLSEDSAIMRFIDSISKSSKELPTKTGG